MYFSHKKITVHRKLSFLDPISCPISINLNKTQLIITKIITKKINQYNTQEKIYLSKNIQLAFNIN